MIAHIRPKELIASLDVLEGSVDGAPVDDAVEMCLMPGIAQITTRSTSGLWWETVAIGFEDENLRDPDPGGVSVSRRELRVAAEGRGTSSIDRPWTQLEVLGR